ncbi:hypothetical protein JOS77_22380 [Chromobacterium haemolyticum]|nr:hypothetical protein JOS77_22380 [Chromobacterium haemolyticum]
MKCSMVIGLILLEGKKDDAELKVCDELLKVRFGKEKYVSIHLTVPEKSLNYADGVDMHTIINAEITNLTDISNKWIESDRPSAGGLGLYIQAHGKAEGPIIDKNTIVEIVKKLYDVGLRFRKINIGWCFAGGGQIFNASQSSGKEFVEKLNEKLGNETVDDKKETRKLENTLFSCYHGVITYKKINDQVRNHRIKNNKPHETHPKANIKETLLELNEADKKINNIKSKLGNSQDKTLYDALSSTIDYVTKNKVIWKVENNIVVRSNLDEYSDSEDIKFMHKVIVGIQSLKMQ